MKLTNQYIGSVLDFNGCYYNHKGEYRCFKIRTNNKGQIKVINQICKDLLKYGIEINKYELKNHTLYQIHNRDSMNELERYQKKYCKIKRK